jgi:hypothetical protein
VAADAGRALPDLQGADRGLAAPKVKNRQKVKTFNVEAANGRLHTQSEATVSDQVTVKMDENASSFRPCPVGTQHAVCVDVVDLGESVDQYQDQPAKLVHKIALVFQADDENPETRKRYEPSIEFTIGTEYERGQGIRGTFGPKSKLRKMLGGWRGKPYTDEEAKAGAPLHKLVGVNAMLNVIHKTSGAGREYAVIESISPPMKSLPKLVPHNYERSDHWQRRKDEYARKVAEFKETHPVPVTAGADYNQLPAALQDDGDDLPF